MKVINLASWSGNGFSVSPGQCVECPDSVAKARIDAGLMKEAKTSDKVTLTLDASCFDKTDPAKEKAETADQRETAVAEEKEER